MKKKALLTIGLCVAIIATTIFSCKKDNQTVQKTDGVSADVLKSIEALGFSTDNVRKRGDGYLVENDIILTEENLTEVSTSPTLRVAETEQYRTTNLVKKLPRTITVSVSNLPTVYATATKNAISRYNALNLRIKFQFVSSNGQIKLVGFNEGPSGGYITLGSSGFPTSGGNPYNEIQMNTNSQAYGTSPDVNYLTSVIQHEMGHCIGFRHTDYMNRAFSCGGPHAYEGSAGVGAINIPGTPAAADPASWMLACSDGTDRTFNNHDKTALNYLY